MVTTLRNKQQLIEQTLNDPRWEAVLAKNKQADGLFIFAVITTQIYCRPSCPARAPNPENICFFDDVHLAKKAGFRACLRCKPDELSLKAMQIRKMTEICRLIEQSETEIDLKTLALKVDLSTYYFHRLFKTHIGLTPKQYYEAHRENRLRAQLAHEKRENNEAHRVTDALYEAGYNSSSQFYEKAQNILGMHAKQYQKGGKDQTIFFAIAQSKLGPVLVAQSAVGVCAILLDDDPNKLINNLQDLFPKAKLVGADKTFEHTIAKVIGLIERPTTVFDLPLDIQGTTFQKRVWQALQTIPVGTTISYRALAQKIGHPKAVRAVASACAANKLAVAVPCHRVVHTDGTLSGYRWGIARKRTLLQFEQE